MGTVLVLHFILFMQHKNWSDPQKVYKRGTVKV